ncbi:hypothetical protein [Streptomyces sp. STR69]|uniref:hypothetical protein n=1 Tax=Streptomyces sp. STR69 TaxID=1796942 RepID=UPI0021C82E8F|nr:hypothetical protein [Streptomyces sp. STR69]
MRRQTVCPVCAEPLEPDDRFCGACDGVSYAHRPDDASAAAAESADGSLPRTTT